MEYKTECKIEPANALYCLVCQSARCNRKQKNKKGEHRMQKMYERDCLGQLISRLTESNNPLLQFIVGPRQTGKTTMYVQALEKLKKMREK